MNETTVKYMVKYLGYKISPKGDHYSLMLSKSFRSKKSAIEFAKKESEYPAEVYKVTTEEICYDY